MNSFRDNFTKVIDHSKNLDSYDQQKLYTSIVDLRNIHGNMLGGFYGYLNKDITNNENKLEMSFLDSMIDTTRKVLQLAESKFNVNDINTLNPSSNNSVSITSSNNSISIPSQNGGSNKLKGGKSYQDFDKKPILMLFHAGWCGHCVEFMPTFEKLKREFVDADKLNVVKISDKNTDLIEKYQIGGFPTIKLYDGKDFHEYQGGRDIVSIRHYVNSVLKIPAIKG
jgi:thiol-disulfide isomerase/thioredoxin